MNRVFQLARESGSWLLAAALVVAAFALPAPAQAEEWAGYTSMREVNQVLVHQGEVWSATSGGVLRFDQPSGAYTRYTRLDGLAGNRVLSVAVDGRGHLWFGTDGQGLSRFRPEEGRFDSPFLDFRDLQVEALAARDSRVFVGMDRGISVFLADRGEVKETYRQLGINLPKDTPVTALALLGDTLFAATSEGMAWASLDQPNLQDPESWKATRQTGYTEDLLVLDDTLLAASRREIFVFDRQQDRFVREFTDTVKVVGLGIYQGRAMGAFEDGNLYRRDGPKQWRRQPAPLIFDMRSLSQQDTALWVGTKTGLRVLGAAPPPPSSEPAGNQFYEMKLLDGALWVASVPNDFGEPHGLYQFDGTQWKIHDRNSGLPSNTLVSLETDGADRLWVGAWGQGVAIRDSSGTWQRLNHTNSVLRGIGTKQDFVAISDVVRDSTGLMWLANVQIGLAVVDGFPPTRSAMYENPALGLAARRDIGEFLIAPGGLKWVSTKTDGVVLFDDGGTPFAPEDDFSLVINSVFDARLTSDRIADLALDRDGRLWLATNNGLNAVRGAYSRAGRTFAVESWRTYTTDAGLPSSEINALELDDQGNVWVGTEGGLTRISPQGEVEFTFTKTNSGLIDNRVKALLFDRGKRELWIGTFDGLSRLRLERGDSTGAAGPVVYPNPLVMGSGGNTLRFAGLPLGAALRIFGLDGQLIAQVEGAPGQGTVEWNGQNEAGFLVGSGVYFFVATDPAGKVVKGRFAVVNSQ